MNDKLDIATDEYVPLTKDNKKNEYFVLMKSPANR